MKSKIRTYRIIFGALGGVLGVSSPALAANGIDNVRVIVSSSKALPNGGSIGGFGYDPTGNGTVYVAGFGTAAQLYRVDNVNLGDAAQTDTLLLSNTQWTLFNKGSDGVSASWALDRGGGAPTIGGILLNTQTIGGNAPFTKAWITDLDGAVTNSAAFDGNTNRRNDLTQRIYSWNLQAPPQGGDGRNVLGSVVTQQQLITATGASATASSNLGRQPVLNGDNSALYFLDSSSAFGGIWRIDTSTNALSHVLTATTLVTTEPAVVTTGNIDRIYFGINSTTNSNPAVEYIDVDRTTGIAGAAQTVLTAGQIRNFLTGYTGTTFPQVTGIVVDAAGDLYLTESNAKATFRYDPQGRLVKVTDSAERLTSSGGASVNANLLREQLRTTTYTGPAGTFTVPEILYQESTPGNNISGLILFKPGDFNRDNSLTLPDVTAFKTALTAANATTPVAATDRKYDLNGDGLVNYADVQILRQFFDLGSGDVNLDGTVDASDYGTLTSKLGSTGALWTDGDLNGDGKVDAADYGILTTNIGYSSSVLVVGTFAAAESATASVVPEPSSVVLLTVSAALLLRRRRVY